MRNKRLSILLSTIVLTSNITYANTLNSPTLLIQEGTLLDITVPLSFPINVDNKGVVSVADNTKIVNNSYGAIEISTIAITPKENWVLSSFDKDYSTEKVGLKEFGFKIDEVDLSDIQNKIEAKQVKAGGELLLSYNANIPPQKENILSNNIANIVLTVNWSGINLSNDLVGTYYSELADKWGTKTSMPTARENLTSSAVGNKIYCIGGYASISNKLSDLNIVEVYDITTDKWETKTPLPAKTKNLTSQVIDGKIYVIGGVIGYSGYVKSVYVYDPVTDSWSEKSPMPTKRGYLTSEVVDGKIYVIGGVTSLVGYTNTVEVYDPVTDSWEEKTSMPTARGYLTSQVVDGKIYCIGGYTTESSFINKVEVYDPKTDSWEEKTPIPEVRRDLTSQVVEGKIHCIGGQISGGYSNTVEVYDPVTDSWETKANMPTARCGMTSSIINGKIYCIGGYNKTTFLNNLEVYDTGYRYE